MVLNSFVTPLLTDLYQITMAYSYWKMGRQDDIATFDIFFRKNPFEGEFTVFCGVESVLELLQSYKFTQAQVDYLRTQLPQAEEEFWTFILSLDTKDVRLHCMKEGCFVFPYEPLARIEGPIAICQLLETPMLCLLNYASLIATNAVRHRIAVGPKIVLSEFGLRRAQGPDGGMTASKYAYLGGFDSTSNVQAGQSYGIPVSGTNAHSYILSFTSEDQIEQPVLNGVNLLAEAQKVIAENEWHSARQSELYAFISYALSFPKSCMCLLDTFDTLNSGLPNFIATAVALSKAGYKATGIRMDSGDLAYLSRMIRKEFVKMDEKYGVGFTTMRIVASNDINVDILYALHKQENEIDCFGIGTNLVTCQGQPALGMVFKLVDINGIPRMKLSEDSTKTTIPGKKDVFRLYGHDGIALLDLVQLSTEEPPKVGERVLCIHVHNSRKRCYCTPSRVERLLDCVWDGEKGVVYNMPPLKERRDYCMKGMASIREDSTRYVTPTAYKVSSSAKLNSFVHEIWTASCPIAELS